MERTRSVESDRQYLPLREMSEGPSSQSSKGTYLDQEDLPYDENSFKESLSNMLLEDSGSSSSSERRSFPYCSLLDAGRAFSGTLAVLSQTRPEWESWGVNVRILGYDLENGYLCGTMETLNAPMEEGDISRQVTFWEGEIIDNKNYTFTTGKWEPEPVGAFRRWYHLTPFSPLTVLQQRSDRGKSLDLSKYPCIFMRWKEQEPVNVESDCGLDFHKDALYYVSFDCHNGIIGGFYFDENCRSRLHTIEFRLLAMEIANDGRLGFSFASYELQ